MVTVRAEVVAVAEELVQAADGWRSAYQEWEAAVARRERKMARAARGVVAATGDLGLYRWEQACHRRRILTVADASLKARALRGRPAVGAAVAERERVRAEADAAVRSARLVLAVESKRMLAYGQLGLSLTGLSRAELARLARRPGRASE